MVGLDEAVIIALGSNLKGEYASLQTLLEAALAALPPEGLKVVRRSSWWRSAAWPDPSAPAYLNGVVIVETTLGPKPLLNALRSVERRFGRARADRNAPRTLDLDLIAHGRTVLNDPGLVLPHPRAAERRFVMGPLAEIAPEWRHPRFGSLARDLSRRAPVGADASPQEETAG